MKLEISYSSGTTHEVDLPGTVAVLGRDPSCDVVLNDSKCSRRHAVVEDGPLGLLVRDAGSANGTYLNGRRVVDEAPLRPGDVLRLGGVRLKVLAGAGETVVMGPEDLDLPTDMEGRRPVPAPEARPRRPATVGVLVAMWALFVPGSVAGCLFAAYRLGGGAVAWTIASAASLLLAGLGTSMALGLRALAPWARHLQIATAALALLACPFTLAAATVLLYMTRPEVKAAFEAAPPPPGLGNDAGEATFALSLVGMLALGFALTAIAALVL